jgi:hypothetical protein
VVKRGGHADQLSRSIWGMDRYRVLALQKILRSGLEGWRRAAAMEVLRRKVELLARGARKRGKEPDAQAYEALLDEFEPEMIDGREGDSRLCPGAGLSPPDA